MKEMVGGCCVCSDERGWPENPLVYCDGQNCTVAVHQACYGIVTVPTGPWFCRKCESQERSARVRCELCPSRDGALKKTDNQGWAHVVCALYIPEVRFGNVTTMEPIILQLIPQERYAKSCYICQEAGKPNRATVGACMQCNKSNCKQQFHVTCAQSLGLLCEEAGNYLDNVKYCGYCQHHYGKLKKGGNVKTIPPYKPITHDTSSDSSLSPEKELDSAMNATASSTSATSIKITTNINAATAKQRKSSTASKQSNSSSSSSSAVTAAVSSSGFGSSLHSSNSSIPVSGNSLGGNSVGSSSGNNNGNLSTNNSSLNSGNSMGSGAGTSASSNLKSSLNNSSSYKEKDKHSKNLNKISSSSKDKDGSSSSSSSRDSREKSSKSSKNKDFSNNSSGGLSSTAAASSTSTTTNTALNMSSSSMHDNHSHNSNMSTQNSAQNLTTSSTSLSMAPTGNSNSSSSVGKEATTKIGSVTVNSSGFGGSSSALDSHVNTLDNSNFSNTYMDTSTSASGMSGNAASGIVGMTVPSSSKNSSSTLAKKRKADSKSNNSIVDDINSPFRDIIKDVSVTLTPLTDFEKEIEKSAKKQKTELSPPTHQAHNTDANSSTQTGSNSSGGNNSHSSASSGATSASISASNASSSSAAVTLSTSNAPHKYTLSSSSSSSLSDTNRSGGATNLSTSNVISSATNSHKSAAASHSISNNSSVGNTNAQSYAKDQHHRDERYTTQAQANSGANNATNAANAGANAPSLYVSVPLSTANVPGINIPTNSGSGGATDHHAPPSQSTRAAAAAISQQQQQQGNSTTAINMSGGGVHAAATSTPLGAGGGGGSSSSSSLGGQLERQSPRIHHQSPSFSDHHSNSNSSYFANTTTGHMQTTAHSSVIHQSGKSPSGNMLLSASSNPNLMATTTEAGNLKISYEKQTTRVNQLQEQETAPVRRSRTPDSGIYSSSSFLTNSSTISNASSSSSSSSGGGLKFSYEPQTTNIGTPSGAIDSTSAHLLTAVTTATASLTATAGNITTTPSTTAIKDSPPSSPGSEIGATAAAAPRKRGRKAKDAHVNESKVDVKLFQNGSGHVIGAIPITAATTTAASSTPTSASAGGTTLHTAAHMLGNQLNPNSNVAQKLSDQLHMEIQDHSIYTADAVMPQFVGVPFPGKSNKNTSSTPNTTSNNTTGTNSISAITPATSEMAGGTSLASMFGSGVNGNMSIPQSLEQLLERQWEQGSQFLMEQAQHFDIASLLSCLHQLQRENVRLEEHVTSLIARRDHLLAVNARLAVPLKTNTTQSQATAVSSTAVTTSVATLSTTVSVAGVTTATSAIAAACAAAAIATTTAAVNALGVSNAGAGGGTGGPGNAGNALTTVVTAATTSLATAVTTSLSALTVNARLSNMSNTTTTATTGTGVTATTRLSSGGNIGLQQQQQQQQQQHGLENGIDFRQASSATATTSPHISAGAGGTSVGSSIGMRHSTASYVNTSTVPATSISANLPTAMHPSSLEGLGSMHTTAATTGIGATSVVGMSTMTANRIAQQQQQQQQQQHMQTLHQQQQQHHQLSLVQQQQQQQQQHIAQSAAAAAAMHHHQQQQQQQQAAHTHMHPGHPLHLAHTHSHSHVHTHAPQTHHAHSTHSTATINLNAGIGAEPHPLATARIGGVGMVGTHVGNNNNPNNNSNAAASRGGSTTATTTTTYAIGIIGDGISGVSDVGGMIGSGVGGGVSVNTTLPASDGGLPTSSAAYTPQSLYTHHQSQLRRDDNLVKPS